MEFASGQCCILVLKSGLAEVMLLIFVNRPFMENFPPELVSPKQLMKNFLV